MEAERAADGARSDPWLVLGCASGAVAVALYLIGGALIPLPDDFGGPASEAAAYFEERDSEIQIGSAFFAASAPFLIWFLATVASLARGHDAGARRAGGLAFGCGVASLVLFLADVAALAVGALRPDNMLASPELAAALLDFSFVAIAMASFLTGAALAAFAVLALRDGAIWPRWLGWLALPAAAACGLRVGTLFTTEGAFTAGGPLGFWAPVVAFVGWIALASIVLTLEVRRT